jgi:hypothetical protein
MILEYETNSPTSSGNEEYGDLLDTLAIVVNADTILPATNVSKNMTGKWGAYLTVTWLFSPCNRCTSSIYPS